MGDHKFYQLNRFEYIDETGRVVVAYLKDNEEFSMSIQDDGRTMKIFKQEKSDDNAM